LDGFLNQTITAINDLDLHAANAAKHITTLMDELRSMINKKEQELLEGIEKQKQEQEEAFSIEKERLEHLQESMRHCSEYTKHLLEHGNPMEIATSSQPVLSRLSSLLSTSIAPPIKPKVPSLHPKTIKEEIGTLLSSLDPVGSFRPSCLTNNSVGHVIRQFNPSEECDLRSFSPCGMALDERDWMYVADAGNHLIHCLTSAGDYLFTFGSKGTKNGEFNCPRDVVFDSKKQRILVADAGNHRIQVFDHEGTFLHSFGSKGNENGEFLFPQGIAIDQGGRVFVSDQDNHRVQVFDDQGKFLWKFGSFGAGEGELMKPCGIEVLSDGSTVVAESWNLRLSIFDPQGQFVRFIAAEERKNLGRIFVDSKDNILFCDSPLLATSSLFVFSKAGIQLKKIALGNLNDARAVLMNGKGEIIVSGKVHQWRFYVF